MIVQILLIIVIPLLLIYSAIVFCYGYKKGHDEGFNMAMRICDKENKQ